jgi:hypothetical protein
VAVHPARLATVGVVLTAVRVVVASNNNLITRGLSRKMWDIPSLELCTLLASMQGGGQGLYELSGLAVTPAKKQR